MSKMFSKWFGGNNKGNKQQRDINNCEETCCKEKREKQKNAAENTDINTQDKLENPPPSVLMENGAASNNKKKDRTDGNLWGKCPPTNRCCGRKSSGSSESLTEAHHTASKPSSFSMNMDLSDRIGCYEPQTHRPTGMPVARDSPHYNMDHPYRGKAVIFNFDKWNNTSVPSLGLRPRLGSEKDKRDLTACLKNLEFDVHTYDNLDSREFWEVIRDVQKMDHRDNDCLVIAIMTHGEKNHIYVKDGTLIPVNLVWEEFEAHNSPSLAGKPKIFLVQACRGSNYDHGTRLWGSQEAIQPPLPRDVTDGANFSYVIPNAADIIVAFSCPLGHYSWRSPEHGSWFIQAICKVLNEHAYTIDLQGCLTAVAREVALNKESSTDNPAHDKKKQVTSTSSTLIRIVQFKPKRQYYMPTLHPTPAKMVPKSLEPLPLNPFQPPMNDPVVNPNQSQPRVPVSPTGASFNEAFSGEMFDSHQTQL